MSHSILSRSEGPFAVSAGVLIVGAQLVMLPFDPKDHVTTTTASRSSSAVRRTSSVSLCCCSSSSRTMTGSRSEPGGWTPRRRSRQWSARWPSVMTCGSRPSPLRGSPARRQTPSTGTRPWCSTGCSLQLPALRSRVGPLGGATLRARAPIAARATSVLEARARPVDERERELGCSCARVPGSYDAFASCEQGTRQVAGST